MSEGPIPKSLQEAAPVITWTVLILGAGLEFITTLVHAELWPCLASFVLLVSMTAALIHWRQLRQWGPLACALAALLVVISVWSPIWDRVWPTPSSTAISKQQLASKNDELESVRRELATIQHPPADTPTWLRLNFDGDGKPSEVASINIHWSWLSLPELSGNYFEMDFGEIAGSMPRPLTVATILFLSFDVPIRPGSLSIMPSKEIPPWKAITQADDRNVIIWLHGQITNHALDIKIR